MTVRNCMPDTDVTLCALAGAVTIGAICATLAPPFSTTYRSRGNTECSARYSTVDAENKVGTSARVAQVSDTSTTEEVNWASGLFESSSSDVSLESTQGSHDSNSTLPVLSAKQVDKIKDLVRPELETSIAPQVHPATFEESTLSETTTFARCV